jgi:hypothetical protein
VEFIGQEDGFPFLQTVGLNDLVHIGPDIVIEKGGVCGVFLEADRLPLIEGFGVMGIGGMDETKKENGSKRNALGKQPSSHV